MKISRRKKCDDVVELLAKNYWSKYKRELNQKIASITQNFISRNLFNSTARVSHQLHAEFEYINNLIDYIIKSMEKDYIHIPFAKYKNKLLTIAEEEYKKLIPRTVARLVESNLYDKGTAGNYENGILNEMKKSMERVEIQCALSEKGKAAEKYTGKKSSQSQAVKAAKIGGILTIIAAIVGSFTLWFLNRISDNSDESIKIPTEVETIRDSQATIVNELGRTPLYARTRKKVDELEHRLINEKLMPWRLLHTGKPFEVTYYDGKVIHFEGVKFSGSPRGVFWSNYIEPFLENGIIEILDATARECLNNNLEPKPYLTEAGWLLKSMIRSIYEYMAETDQRLLGKEERKDVSDKIAKMNQTLEEHKTAVLHLFSKTERFNTKSKAIIKDSNKSIEPEEKEADVNLPGLSPIIKIPETSIAPEEIEGDVNEPEKKEIIKKKEPSIEPE